ncbi:NUDIX hydrolase [Methyloversatilis thermotolerans]|uniref:NUDIX hydrolase n=1 Tax=Methyloversatilis thermotolerans TaxID=1346290 RepID=UPI000365EE56|nr:NUDIX hydrolase [Methyloversatilis thermotolerans]
MSERIWKPNVTVAALMEDRGRFLMVEEHTSGGLLLNQPAGHLEEGESLVEACAREALEETAHVFAPRELVGIYQWRRPDGEVTYLRFAFSGDSGEEIAGRALDAGIVRAIWMTADEIEASRGRHRSPLVWACVKDWLDGTRMPLSVIRHHC